MLISLPRCVWGLALLLGLAFGGCQSNDTLPDSAVAADLNSSNPAVVAQAQKVQQLMTQIKQQEAVINAEKAKLDALKQQLAGSQQNLDGLKKEAQATP